MRLPRSRTASAHRAFSRRHRHGRRLFTLALVAVATVLAGTGIVLAVRSRAPILPVAETTGSLDAIELWRAGDYRGVSEVATRHLERYPLDETSLSLRGFSYFFLSTEAVGSDEQQDLLIRAVQDLRKVLLSPAPAMEPEVRYILGKSYYHRGTFFYDLAIRELEHARDLGIDNLDLLEYLALAHDEIGNRQRAIEYFQAALNVGDEDVHRVSLADLLVLEGRYSEAEDILERVITDTDDVMLQQHSMLTLARSRRNQSRYDQALATLEELLEVNPDSAEARFQLGETYLAMNENERARFQWREALRLNPNHIESFQRLREY